MLEFLSKFTHNFICEIADQFCLGGSVKNVELHGNGNVNDTYLLHCDNGKLLNRFTLQRINHEVFKKPEELMENFLRVTSHLSAKISQKITGKKSLILIKAKDGNSFHKDYKGNYWRVTKFVDGGRSFEIPDTSNQAYEAAKAFGEFQVF